MYKEYFGLKEKPFSIVPNPHYFYMSEGHREAMAHLLYGVKGEGGFVLLTGEVGAGKTTVCRVMLQLLPQDLEVAFLLNPPLTVEELLATICDEFGIAYSSDTTSVKAFVAQIQAYLLDAHARGRRAILVVEEAQNLSTEVLEQIRLLTNLETNEHKLLQIIMIGQPELRDKLAQFRLSQFVPQFGLPDHDDLEKLALVCLEIGQQSNLLEHFRTEILGLLDDEDRSSTSGVDIEQVSVNLRHKDLRACVV
jgi:general secretion pathway protein A